MAMEFSKYLNKNVSEAFFRNVIAEYQYSNNQWSMFLYDKLLEELPDHYDKYNFYLWLTDVFIRQMFHSVEIIQAFLRPRTDMFSRSTQALALRYSLTPLGERIQACLPCLLPPFN